MEIYSSEPVQKSISSCTIVMDIAQLSCLIEISRNKFISFFFRIKWIKKSSILEFFFSLHEMDLTDVHITLNLVNHFRITGELTGFDLTNPAFTN